MITSETTIYDHAVDADVDFLSMDVTVIETCDCGHMQADHFHRECNACANAQNPSPDRLCRAGGFTNAEVRQARLMRRESFAANAVAAVA